MMMLMHVWISVGLLFIAGAQAKWLLSGTEIYSGGAHRFFPCDRRINNLIASPNYSSWADTDRNLLLINLASASIWFWMTRLLSGRWGVWELSSLRGLQSLILNGKWEGLICFWKCLEMQIKAQRLALSRQSSADEWKVFVCWHPLCPDYTFFSFSLTGGKVDLNLPGTTAIEFLNASVQGTAPPSHSLLGVKGLTSHI